MKIALSSLPSMLIDMDGDVGISGTMFSIIMEADSIAATAMLAVGKKIQIEAAVQHGMAVNNPGSPEARWNENIAEYKMKEAEFILDVAAVSEGVLPPESLESSKENMKQAQKELNDFLYDPSQNPYYEEGTAYTTDDLQYKEIPDE